MWPPIGPDSVLGFYMYRTCMLAFQGQILCVVSLAFFIFPHVCFSSHFLCEEECEKITQQEKSARKYLILHYMLGKNVSQLRFSRVFLAFLLTNANPTHSVIGL